MALILTVLMFINFIGYKTGEQDSTAETKQISEDITNLNRNNENENLTISDSELQYIIDNYDQFEHTNIIEQLLNVFRRNQIIFLVLLITEMSLTCFLLFITWKKKESSIIMLQEIYKDLNSKEASLLFYTIFMISFVLNSAFYPLGFYSLVSKKVNIFKMFSTYSLYTAILTVFIIYLNM
jgi:hypothetical protein